MSTTKSTIRSLFTLFLLMVILSATTSNATNYHQKHCSIQFIVLSLFSSSVMLRRSVNAWYCSRISSRRTATTRIRKNELHCSRRRCSSVAIGTFSSIRQRSEVMRYVILPFEKSHITLYSSKLPSEVPGKEVETIHWEDKTKDIKRRDVVHNPSIPELSVVEDDWGEHATNPSSQVSLSSLKESFLVLDLNPSQIEAVTQPVQTLRSTGISQYEFPFIDDHFETDNEDSTGKSIITRVIAGPGSGKTKVLTTRIAYLIEQTPSTSGNILAVTFTRKAAGEMQDRLERILRELEELQRQKHSIVSDDSDDDDDGTLRLDRHGNILMQEEEYVNGLEVTEDGPPKGLERVDLGTFHSICAKIMRYNGELLSDLPSVHRDMSHASPVFVDSPQDSSDDKQKETPSSSVMEIPEINLDRQFVIVDQAEQLRILKEVLDEQKIDLKTLPIKALQILSTISTMKEKFAQGMDPFHDKKEKPPGTSLRIARKVYYRYREKLLSNNAVDFDDLILMTRELLMEHDDLRRRLHRRWPHVLVDEFQDTSKTQIDLIKLLTSSTLFVVGDSDQSIYSWRGAHSGSLHDVKTEFASYGEVRTVYLKENYRSTSNIVRAAEKVISLGQQQAPQNESGGATGELRRSMKPKRGKGPSPRVIACQDEHAEANFVVDTILNMTESNDIGLSDSVAILYRTNAQSRQLEEACVAKNLPYVIRGGAGGFYKRAEIKDCLCFLRWLYNGNDDGSMIRAFKTPSKGIGEKALEEFRTYYENVRAYLREFYPLNMRPTPLDVLVSMTQSEDEVTEGIKLPTLPNGVPMAEEYISKRALNNFLAFSSKMKRFRAMAYTLSVDDLLFHIIEEMGLMDHFDSISKSSSEFNERKENVQELRQAAKKYASVGKAIAQQPSSEDTFGTGSALANFLDDVALVSDVAETSEKDQRVSSGDRMIVDLMTIHASKGMEFDCVFVVGLEEGTLPCNPALQDEDNSVQLEEEKRLCYVAMTRAKTQLILTWRREVTVFSGWSESGPKIVSKKRSRFLEALVSKKSKINVPRTRSKTNTRNPATETQERHATSSPRMGRNGIAGPKQEPQKDISPGVPEYLNSLKLKRHARTNATEAIQIARKGQSPTVSDVVVEKTNASVLTTKSASRGKQISKPDKETSVSVDPTWFFPIGEKIVHRNLGRGIVLEHPPYERIEDAHVRVKFDNGKMMEFPAFGTDIIPDFGS